ncbi:FixH family protein [Antarcticirhabdus aurantiaca]|uniref:FixH family protein n=1 Tax=Antarcticirhabdus aurantiaca TaxID=2606717 RepID=A0ACD4NRG5_9HYPH|nr:FixH family protein [Antarcticirhabdus aurantiaca]WAJ29498.1 FixH family protein [Jeongeuplla avenae]
MNPSKASGPAARRGFVFTGRHMVGVVALFFGTIIGVNVVMAYKAISTFPGLNAKNSYVASQTYNLLLDEAAEQEARGWTSTVTLRGGRLEFRLRDAAGRPVPGLDVRALAGRPASAASDRLLRLAPAGDGFEAGEVLERGRWLVEIEARQGPSLAWRETRALSTD